MSDEATYPPLTDPREIRQLFNSMGYGYSPTLRGSAIDAMVRNSLREAQHFGLNGEDLYTLLAHRLMLAAQAFEKRALELAYLAPPASLLPEGKA